MSLEEAIAFGQQTIFATIYISAPVLIAALVVGLSVSLLQAVTQIQEITLVFIPKIAAVMAMLMVMGSWMLTQAVTFGVASFSSVAEIGR